MPLHPKLPRKAFQAVRTKLALKKQIVPRKHRHEARTKLRTQDAESIVLTPFRAVPSKCECSKRRHQDNDVIGRMSRQSGAQMVA